MSEASTRPGVGTAHRIERWQPWIAGLLSGVLHVLLLLLAMLMPPVPVTSADSAAAGSRVEVNFIGETPPHPIPSPPVDTAPASRPAEAAPARRRLQPPPIENAEEPVLPDAIAQSDADTASRNPQSEQRPDTPAPSAAPPPPTTQRRSRTWGQPPGMLVQETAPVNMGTARSPTPSRGTRGQSTSSGPSLEVGGYHVYYDLFSEERLRAWRDQGMTELFLPLPGTRQYMVCPLETALRRESGECRLLEPNDPELANIGDARKAINMQRVYRQGDLLWSGPRPYR